MIAPPFVFLFLRLLELRLFGRRFAFLECEMCNLL
jgi:hypothetical protein